MYSEVQGIHLAAASCGVRMYFRKTVQPFGCSHSFLSVSCSSTTVCITLFTNCSALEAKGKLCWLNSEPAMNKCYVAICTLKLSVTKVSFTSQRKVILVIFYTQN